MCYSDTTDGGAARPVLPGPIGGRVCPRLEIDLSKSSEPAGDVIPAPVPVNGNMPVDRLEADMTLAHAELLAAARIRSNMTGHLNRAMEGKLNESVALAAARYAIALTAFEAAS